MEFWRIYRLLLAKRWLIAAIALVAFVVILIGTALQAQNHEYRAEAILQPQDLTSLQQVLNQTGTAPAGTAGDGGDGVAPVAIGGSTNPESSQDRVATISDLIMLLRTSNDLYVKTATLLQEPEAARRRDVGRILDRNGFFAPLDVDIDAQAQALRARGEILPNQVARWTADNIKAARDKTVAALAEGRDAQGDFGRDGLRLGAEEIDDRIRDHMEFDTVSGPLSTENSPQIVNQIKVTGRFPREAEANLYVNMLCVAFIDFYTEKSAGAANARIALLKDKLSQADAHLETVRDQQVAYQRSQASVAPVAAGGQDPAVQQLYQYEAQRSQAAQDAQAAAASVATLQGLLARESPVETTLLPPSERPLVETLQAHVADLRAQYDEIAASNEGAPRNPKFQAARRKLDAAEAELNAALQQPVTKSARNPRYDDLKAQLSTAMVRQVDAEQRLAELDQQIGAQHATLANLPAAQARLADLRREVGIAERNVTDLEYALDRMQLFLVESGKAGTIAIVSQSHSTLLEGMTPANRARLLVYGTLLALLLGAAMVVAMDAVDNSIRSVQDVEQLLGLPICGTIPAQDTDPERAPRITALDPLSPVAESYRLLRTDLFFTAAERPFHSLMVATGKPGQGATTTVCNLAIAFANAGKRVILVDADLRRPKLHSVFHVPNDLGLTSVLYGDAAIENALQPTGIDNLLLLPTGPLTLHPSELLSSGAMRRLHDQLKARAEFVLFDTPSAIAFSDATILSSFLDATLMVVRAFNIPRGSENAVRSMLVKARANLIGVVLNGVPADQVDSVHYHYHYYPQLSPKRRNHPDGGGSGGGELPAGGSGAAAVLPPVLRPQPVPAVAVAATGMAAAAVVAEEPAPATIMPVGGGSGSAALAATSAEPFLVTREKSLWTRWKLRSVALVLTVGVALGGLMLALANSAASVIAKP